MKKSNFLPFILIVNVVLLMACEKETEELPATQNGYSAVGVLNDNSGFDSVYNYNAIVAGVGGQIGIIDFLDLTIESNSNLNFVFTTTTSTQQGNSTSTFRKTKNLLTNQMVPLPAKANDLSAIPRGSDGLVSFARTFEGFRPFTNHFTVGLISAKSGSAGNVTYSASFLGDVIAGPMIAPVSFPVGIPTMGFKYPSINPAGKSAFGFGVPNPDYTFSVNNLYDYDYPAKINKKFILGGHNESRFLNGETSKCFLLGHDSLNLYDVVYTNNIANSSLIGNMPVSGLDGVQISKTITNYSRDGKIMGLLFMEENTRKCWSFSYNFNTSVLTQVLNNIVLEYSAAGSDIDVDEFGNVIYSGIAGNGGNPAGVSIYKRNATSNTLVGADNLLKFGTVIGLRSIDGNVYFVVTGKKTENQVSQLTILKQQ